MALLASAGTLALTWRCARLRGLDPVLALLAVGANPLYVIYGLGRRPQRPDHARVMMGAVALTLRRQRDARREAWAGGVRSWPGRS